jgi:crotonobetainyl-CoA:carnitine CoA-transferase CaiB-like acyl-CoA transferase
MQRASFSTLLRSLWSASALGESTGGLECVELVGTTDGLPSPYAVGDAAAAQVAAATLAVAEVDAARTGSPVRRVRIDGAHVVAAFRSEHYLRPVGWSPPPLWDPLSGNFETLDGGWIRLHTNYANHREAALRVLGVAADRRAVASAVRACEGEALESAIVAEGGCAARLRTLLEWSDHPQGAAVAAEPLVRRDSSAVASEPHGIPPLGEGQAPLRGIRVVDLTRVIAGPVCTRFLAAYGADVARVDPPGFEEGAGLLADSAAGKRRVALDLREPGDRHAFESLLTQAHVIVCGYRSDALERLGYSAERLRALRPGLTIALLDAYGWAGPWRTRRGFDSLVQMSSGIAAHGSAIAGVLHPVPLPAQALDHGAGYLLSAAVCRALVQQIVCNEVTTVRVSLARTARWLVDFAQGGDPASPDFSAEDAKAWMERADTPWGPVDRVRCPGRIEGFTPHWGLAQGSQ